MSGASYIEWVNHASYIFEHEGTRLLCDPWLEDTAFHDSWSLLSPTVFRYEDFGRVTHIWFSHEHPDHFSPPVLRKVPSDLRKRIVVLYHQTRDKRVVNFCRGLGFKDVVELRPGAYLRIGTDFDVMCFPIGGLDSWLHMKTSDLSVVNLNDCLINTEEQIRAVAYLTGCIDVLLTQFSYAQYEGNPEHPAERESAARKKLTQIRAQLGGLRPRYTIPFASYVWFSHEDNYYMNDHINTIGRVYEYLRKYTQTVPVVLYPGKTWEISTKHNSERSVARYEADYNRIAEGPLARAVTVEEATLVEAAEKLRQRVLSRISWYHFILQRPLRIYVTDYARAYGFSFLRGLYWTGQPLNDNDVAMSSDALLYCLQFDWGFNTIHVSGKFHIPRMHGLATYRVYESIGSMMNNDDIAYCLASVALGRAVDKVKSIARSEAPLDEAYKFVKQRGMRVWRRQRATWRRLGEQLARKFTLGKISR